MRLLNASTREFEEYFGRPPKYAILSHTWGVKEVTFDDMKSPSPGQTPKLGHAKIHGCCKQALRDGLDYVWVDTCCIDKSSSAELTEAINSMYNWLWQGGDVPPGDHAAHSYRAFRKSRWFTRGWTLQELLAPQRREFFDSSWRRILLDSGTQEVAEETGPNVGYPIEEKMLSEITGIPEACFRRRYPEWTQEYRIRPRWTAPSEYSVAQRMSWAANRRTTREEDMAYCLVGIFGVNMPLLYGEGERAFVRLQEEITRGSPDQSLFCWGHRYGIPFSMRPHPRAIALSPRAFAFIGSLSSTEQVSLGRQDSSQMTRPRCDATHFTMTNQGVLITLPLEPIDDETNTVLGILNVRCSDQALAIVLVPFGEPYTNMYARAPGSMPFTLPSDYLPPPAGQSIYIRSWGLGDWPQPVILRSLGRWSVKLDGSTWADGGWVCYGWYPPIPMTGRLTLRPVEGARPQPPPHFLAAFTDRRSTVLCYIDASQPGVVASIAVLRDQGVTPLDVLYSHESKTVEYGRLRQHTWAKLQPDGRLRLENSVVLGTFLNHRARDFTVTLTLTPNCAQAQEHHLLPSTLVVCEEVHKAPGSPT